MIKINFTILEFNTVNNLNENMQLVAILLSLSVIVLFCCAVVVVLCAVSIVTGAGGV